MNKTCPLCGAILIPRYEFLSFCNDKVMLARHICPDCIPPEVN